MRTLYALALLAAPTTGAQFVGGSWEVQAWASGAVLGVNDLGCRIATVGDIDGDGQNDFAVSSCRSLVHPFAEGPILILSGATAAPLVTIPNPVIASGTGFGRSLACPGDLDRDGVSDLVVGAPEDELGFPLNAGSVRAYSGASGALIWEVFGGAGSAQIGEALATMEDLDFDLVPDLVTVASDAGAERIIVMSGRSGATLASFRVLAPLSFNSISSIGDLDGDRLRDIVVGGSGPWNMSYSLPHTFQGFVGVYSSATGALLNSWMGAGPYSSFGYLVAGTPDLDGDAQPDVIAVAKGHISLQIPPDLFALSPSSGSVIWTRPSIMSSSAYLISLGWIPDLNLDGVVDVVFAGPFVLGSVGGGIQVFSGAGGSPLVAVPGVATTVQFGSAVVLLNGHEAGSAPAFLVGDLDAGAGGSGEVSLIRLDPFLTISRTTVSAATGGIVEFELQFPPSYAGGRYTLLASGTGIGPSNFAGVDVPLTMDTVFRRMLHAPPQQFRSPAGRLDGNARARSRLILAPGVASGVIGRSFWFASLAEEVGGFRRSSIARMLQFEP